MCNIYKTAVLFFLFFIACSVPDTKKETTKSEQENQESKNNKEGLTQEQPWDEFWSTFNKAIQNNDVNTVTELTMMPLKGHYHGDLDAHHFASHFGDIFDDKVKEEFLNADARNFNTINVQSPEQAAAMNVPNHMEVKVLDVLYLRNAGKENQTERSVIFNFGKVGATYKLLSILYVG